MILHHDTNIPLVKLCTNAFNMIISPHTFILEREHAVLSILESVIGTHHKEVQGCLVSNSFDMELEAVPRSIPRFT